MTTIIKYNTFVKHFININYLELFFILTLNFTGFLIEYILYCDYKIILIEVNFHEKEKSVNEEYRRYFKCIN